jgi:hypothetical protein
MGRGFGTALAPGIDSPLRQGVRYPQWNLLALVSEHPG